MKKIPAVFSWSGGKDSSFALLKVYEEGIYNVRYLLGTFNGHFHRLSMHGVREELMETQAESIGIPLLKVHVYESNNAEYESQMNVMFARLKEEGIATVIYGDIFLEDLRKYREEKMENVGMQCIFPLWKMDTRNLLSAFLDKGFKTCVCCVNDGYLHEDWVGKIIDQQFIKDLPENVDPCGENGEFHSFCFDGPIFSKPLAIQLGEKTYKPLEIKFANHPTAIRDVGTKGFWFIDILL